MNAGEGSEEFQRHVDNHIVTQIVLAQIRKIAPEMENQIRSALQGTWIYGHAAGMKAQQKTIDEMVTEFKTLRREWDDAYAAFIGAFDTPIAWRKNDDDYAQDSRARMKRVNELINPNIEGTDENWENRTLGADPRYVEVVEDMEVMIDLKKGSELK